MIYRTEAEWRASKGLPPENYEPKPTKAAIVDIDQLDAPSGISMKDHKWSMTDQEWLERQRLKKRGILKHF